MSRRAKREEKVKSKIFSKLIVTAILLALAFMILKLAPNYVNTEITDKANLVINNSNVTQDLKKDVIIENGVIYISKEDISNFFDPHIYYDEKYNQIVTTSNTKVASMVIGQNEMINNGTKVQTSATVIEKEDTIYIPFSTFKDIYNVEIGYIESTNTITVDSKDRKFVKANSLKDDGVKAYPTVFSRNVDTLKQGESFVVVQNEEQQNQEENGWTEIRTDRGKLGYIKSTNVQNEYTVREDLTTPNQEKEKISMI